MDAKKRGRPKGGSNLGTIIKGGCFFCEGTGVHWGSPCGACDGTGKDSVRKQLHKAYNAKHGIPINHVNLEYETN